MQFLLNSKNPRVRLTSATMLTPAGWVWVMYRNTIYYISHGDASEMSAQNGNSTRIMTASSTGKTHGAAPAVPIHSLNGSTNWATRYGRRWSIGAAGNRRRAWSKSVACRYVWTQKQGGVHPAPNWDARCGPDRGSTPRVAGKPRP